MKKTRVLIVLFMFGILLASCVDRGGRVNSSGMSNDLRDTLRDAIVNDFFEGDTTGRAIYLPE